MNQQKKEILKHAYAVIAELWCSPQDVDMEKLRIEAEKISFPVPADAEGNENVFVNEENLGGAVYSLYEFLQSEVITEEDYIELFELNPDCSLYLGSHSYEEPKTCAGGAVSNRNEYMIELQAIYRHFGMSLDGRELADYLPVMINFLSLTVDKSDDAVRKKFIKEYFLPFLPPVRKRLEELNTSYWHLLDAVERLANYDLQLCGTPNIQAADEEKQTENFNQKISTTYVG